MRGDGLPEGDRAGPGCGAGGGVESQAALGFPARRCRDRPPPALPSRVLARGAVDRGPPRAEEGAAATPWSPLLLGPDPEP